MKKAFTLVELLVTVVLLGILVAIVFPYISNYVTWARQTSDMRSLLITNDAIDRSRAAADNISQYIGSNYTVPNGVVQQTAVLNFLANGGVTVIPNDKFATFTQNNSSNMGTLAAKFFSAGSGDSFRFYDYNSDGLVLGTFEVPPS